MKSTITLLLLFALSLAAFAQSPGPKKDSTVVAGDTIKIDLLKYNAYEKLLSINNDRLKIQAEAQVLQERNKGLDSKSVDIIDAEYRHDPRYDAKREVIDYKIVGMELVVVWKKLPAVAEDKKKKPK